MATSAAMRPENMPNVGLVERWVSTVGGGVLVLNGLLRPSPVNTLLALGGAALVGRGVTGVCSLYRALGIDTAGRPASGRPSVQGRHAGKPTYGYGKRGARSIRDEHEEAIEDSFPASDPPAWTVSGTARGVHEPVR